MSGQAMRPPYSKEAERALVGALILTPAGLPAVLELLGPTDLYGPREQRLLEAVVTLDARGEPIDVATVAIEAGVERRAIQTLIAECPASINAPSYARTVAKNARRRRLQAAGQRLALAATAATNEVDDVIDIGAIDEVRRLLDEAQLGHLGAGCTWEPANLALTLAGGDGEEEPTMLVRNDGVTLLYPGRIHAFNAEPESGKTWLALVACAERIDMGQHVLYFDFEDRASSVVARLLALGLDPPAILDRFHYIRPEEPLGRDGRAVLADVLGEFKPTLVVLDGVTECLTLHGWDLKDNTDVAKFIGALPRPLAREGAAVVLIDHVGRDREARGRFALGAGHKLAGVDVAYALETVKPFGRGLDGVARIVVAKDRPGQVRQHAVGGTRVAELHLRSREDNRVEAELVQPRGETTFRPTGLMEKLSRILELRLEGLNSREVRADLSPAKNETKDLALSTLVADGYVRIERRGAAHVHVSVKRYREDDETDD